MKKSAILISALFFVGLTPAFAEDGARLFQRKGCTTCHGVGGAKPITAQYPSLAGQNAEYIVEQLNSFKDGHRTGINAQQMVQFAKSISKDGAENQTAVASYLAAQAFVGGNNVDADLVEKGKAAFTEKGCTSCHGEGANAPIMPAYPKLAGLSPQYVINQLNAFRDGSRKGTNRADAMAPMATTLAPEEVAAVANYLGSLSR